MKAVDNAATEYMVLRDFDATHDRRVRLILTLGSAMLILIGVGIFVAFALDGRWINCLFESPVPLVGLACAFLVRRGQIRSASLLMIFSLLIIFCAIALLGDVPRPHIPRTSHLCLFPLAFGSYIALKREPAWLRHGVVLLCLGACVFLATTNIAIDVGLFLPDGPHAVINWVISICAIGVLYLFLCVYMGDVGRMESYLHLANNRLVNLVGGMFPKIIAERLLTRRETFAERYDDCSVLFADIIGFTSLSERMAPEALIAMLSDIFLRFDQCVEHHGLTKIKTIGDAYMVAAGVPEPDPNHAENMIHFAIKMLDVVKEFPDLQLRIGIASGSLVAGVIGQSRQVYDVWGNVVNLASRIESLSGENQIQVSESTYTLVNNKFNFNQRSGITIKGKAGLHNLYLLTSVKEIAE